MKKFIIMTRGRTGSTAVIDSLNKTNSICTEQELFLKYNFNRNIKRFIEPFDVWLDHEPVLTRLYGKLFSDKALVKSYLREVEARAMSTGKMAFGFKVLSHHFNQRPNLKEVLLENGYRTIYLRRNVIRQVISGMIAKVRGVYNVLDTENYKDDSRYTIDISEFESWVNSELQEIANDLDALETAGGSFIVERYENFMKDRQSFFRRVFEFIGVTDDLPQESAYSILIKDISYSVKNYQAVMESAIAMGLNIE